MAFHFDNDGVLWFFGASRSGVLAWNARSRKVQWLPEVKGRPMVRVGDAGTRVACLDANGRLIVSACPAKGNWREIARSVKSMQAVLSKQVDQAAVVYTLETGTYWHPMVDPVLRKKIGSAAGSVLSANLDGAFIDETKGFCSVKWVPFRKQAEASDFLYGENVVRYRDLTYRITAGGHVEWSANLKDWFGSVPQVGVPVVRLVASEANLGLIDVSGQAWIQGCNVYEQVDRKSMQVRIDRWTSIGPATHLFLWRCGVGRFHDGILYYTGKLPCDRHPTRHVNDEPLFRACQLF